MRLLFASATLGVVFIAAMLFVSYRDLADEEERRRVETAGGRGNETEKTPDKFKKRDSPTLSLGQTTTGTGTSGTSSPSVDTPPHETPAIPYPVAYGKYGSSAREGLWKCGRKLRLQMVG